MAQLAWTAVFLATLVAGCGNPVPEQQAPLTVGAASSMEPLLHELSTAFTQETGVDVIFSFGATGSITSQIEQGAPIDVFAAADTLYMKRLETGGYVTSGGWMAFAQGQLLVVGRSQRNGRLEGIDDLLLPSVRFVALANPDVAPYGNAAREALRHAGLWKVLQPKLVYGGNVRQALQFVETGNADAALVPLSLLLDSDLAMFPVDEDAYAPVVHTVAVIKGAAQIEAAQAFVAFVTASENHTVVQRNGYLAPPRTETR
jgi:molybdate transport system substrate-binding protein